jgi:hypothetical protein
VWKHYLHSKLNSCYGPLKELKIQT